MAVVSRMELESSLAELAATVGDPREGILGPRSLGWRLGADLGLFVGGGRAALLQLAHPFVAYAIDQHSETRSDVTGRFQRTFRNVFAMLYGDLDDAFRAARRVHAIHTRVHGTIPEPVGDWAAGTPYHANDLDALIWVHSTLADTTLVMRDLLDGPLEESIKTAYLTELARFGALFGIPATRLPRTWREHRDYMHAMLGSARIAVAPCARDMARFLFGRGEPARSQPALGRLAETVTHELLPPHLAEQFGLRAAPRRTRAVLATFTAAYRRLPRGLVEFPACAEARNRVTGDRERKAGWSGWTERQLFALARRTTGSGS